MSVGKWQTNTFFIMAWLRIYDQMFKMLKDVLSFDLEKVKVKTYTPIVEHLYQGVLNINTNVC